MKRFAAVLVLLALFTPTRTNAEEKPSGKISGYMFGDYYWIAANHADSLKNQNGFWFRRIFFTYDKKLNDEFAIRFRFEANSPGLWTSLRGKSDRLNPYIKDASLKWTRGRHSILFGLVPTPTWELAEKVWGYRPVEKTPLDLQRLGAPRDFGVVFQGVLDPDKKLAYSFLIGNGNSINSETDKDKKLYLSLVAKPVTGVTIEAYGDWENREGEKDVRTLQGIASYERKSYRVGALVAQQIIQQGPGAKEDVDLELLSIFGTGKLNEKAWIFGRFDQMFDQNVNGAKIDYIPFDPGLFQSSLIVAGVDLMPIGDVHLMPNVEVVVYEELEKGGPDPPDTDVIPRLTVYYVF